MAEKTSNYNLIKPWENETVDINVINGNFDIIDTKIKENHDHIDNAVGNIGDKANLSTSDKSNLVNAVNEVSATMADKANQIDLDITRLSKTTTGISTEYNLDTSGTFDLTKDGNILPLVPHLSNTGSATITVDSQTAKSIKKFDVDTDAYVNIGADDIKKNTPTTLTWDSGNDFFVYAPKGGASKIDSMLNQTLKNNINGWAATNVSRLTVNGSGWVVLVNSLTNNTSYYALKVDGSYVVGDASRGGRLDDNVSDFLMFRFESSFEFLSTSATDNHVIYLLGDSFEETTLGIYDPYSSTISMTQRLNVTGSGWIYGIHCGSTMSYMKFTIDSVVIANSYFPSNSMTFLVRFENGFEFKTDNPDVALTYALD